VPSSQAAVSSPSSASVVDRERMRIDGPIR
jgi:hypothetical protein